MMENAGRKRLRRDWRCLQFVTLAASKTSIIWSLRSIPRLNMHGGLLQDQIHSSPERSPSMKDVDLQ